MSRSPEWENLSVAIQETLSNHQIEFPVKVGQVAKDLGIDVKKSTLPAGKSGQIKLINGHGEIKVNRHDTHARQRFTIAHEIAHFLLHHEMLVGDGIIDDVLYRSNLSDELEAQANRLAADIIMPWNLIKEKIQTFGDVKLKDEHIELIANDAEVSVAAMKIRLGKL